MRFFLPTFIFLVILVQVIDVWYSGQADILNAVMALLAAAVMAIWVFMVDKGP